MNCVEEIAASIGLQCENPLVGGYTGRAILIPKSVFRYQHVTVTRDNNPCVVNIALSYPSHQFPKAVVCLDNALITSPFEGSNTAGNEDEGYRRFLKVLNFRVPERGGLVSKNIIEPLQRGEEFCVIVERRDNNVECKYEVIGLYNFARVVDQTTTTRSETENGGAWNFVLQTTEFYGEVTFVDDPSSQGQPSLALTKAAFERFMLYAMNI